MSHFAQVINGIVTQVIVAEQDFIDTFVDATTGEWLQTSYNTYGGVHYDPVTKEPSADQSKALRKNFAGVGFNYDAEKDAFIPFKPYNSWLLDNQSCLWIPPIPCPNDNYLYKWDEENLQWLKQKEKPVFSEITNT